MQVVVVVEPPRGLLVPEVPVVVLLVVLLVALRAVMPLVIWEVEVEVVLRRHKPTVVLEDPA